MKECMSCIKRDKIKRDRKRRERIKPKGEIYIDIQSKIEKNQAYILFFVSPDLKRPNFGFR